MHPHQSTASAPRKVLQRGTTTKILFDDGDYFIALTDQFAVRIGLKGCTCFDIPMGHAYFQRVAESTTRTEVESLHDELVGAYA